MLTIKMFEYKNLYITFNYNTMDYKYILDCHDITNSLPVTKTTSPPTGNVVNPDADFPYLHIYKILSAEKIANENLTIYHQKLDHAEFSNISNPDSIKEALFYLHQTLKKSQIGDTISIIVFDPYTNQKNVYLATILYLEDLEKKVLRIDFPEFKYPFLTDFLSLYRIIFRLDIKKWHRSLSSLMKSVPDVEYSYYGKTYIFQHFRHPLLAH